jgi:hypothetical protein
MNERVFQAKLNKRLKRLFPGCIILKNDPEYLQGILDWIILFEDRWAAYDAKGSSDANVQPNQEYYVEYLNKMSFAAFVSPENEEWFINELQQAFRSNRRTRLP